MKQKIFLVAKRSLKGLLKTLSNLSGFHIEIKRAAPEPDREGVNLNVGAGQYIIRGFISLDLYTDHYYKESQKDFIEYDMRKGNLPFQNGTVDNIYCSHVIEHIETAHVAHFISDCHRVLRRGGVLRIACPDAEFLWRVSMFKNDYWKWRESSLKNKNFVAGELGSPTQKDFFIREIATPRCRYIQLQDTDLVVDADSISWNDYRAACDSLTKSLVFNIDRPGDHINYWDFERLALIGEESGFAHVIRSKPNASVSKSMRGHDMDRKHPYMSLYVEFVK